MHHAAHTHTHTRCTTQRSRKSTNENTYTYIYTYIYKYPENIDRERAAPSSLSRAQCRFLERCAAQRSRNESTFSRALCQAAPSSAVRSRNGAVRLRARENDSRTRRENRTLHSPSHCTALEKMTSDVRLVWCCYGVVTVLLWCCYHSTIHHEETLPAMHSLSPGLWCCLGVATVLRSTMHNEEALAAVALAVVGATVLLWCCYQ